MPTDSSYTQRLSVPGQNSNPGTNCMPLRHGAYYRAICDDCITCQFEPRPHHRPPALHHCCPIATPAISFLRNPCSTMYVCYPIFVSVSSALRPPPPQHAPISASSPSAFLLLRLQLCCVCRIWLPASCAAYCFCLSLSANVPR